MLSNDAGATWKYPDIPPHGYRNCVEYLQKNEWISCSINGVDITNDNGYTRKWVSKESLNVCRKAKERKSVFFAGGKAKIGKLGWD